MWSTMDSPGDGLHNIFSRRDHHLGVTPLNEICSTINIMTRRTFIKHLGSQPRIVTHLTSDDEIMKTTPLETPISCNKPKLHLKCKKKRSHYMSEKVEKMRTARTGR